MVISSAPTSSSPSSRKDESKVEEEQRGEEFRRKALDADIQQSAPRVMKHMNGDHPDSLKAYVLAFGTPAGDCRRCESAVLTGLDVDGFLMEIVVKGRDLATCSPGSMGGVIVVKVRVPYDRPLQSAKDLHQVAIRMHMSAYRKLGVWYKIRTGYYSRAFRMIGAEVTKTLGKAKTRETIRTVATKSTVFLLGSIAAALTIHGYNRRQQQQRLLLKD